MSDDRARSAPVFGTVAAEYDRWRPGYPGAVVDWLLEPGAAEVLDLGAGTGKLTAALVARGLRVTAVEPDAAMLAVLADRHPDVPAHQAVAESLPLADDSVDAVLVGQAWRWFTPGAAVAEVCRVLRPGGWLGLAWHTPLWRTAGGAAQWERELAHLDPDAAGFDADRADQEAGDGLLVPGLPSAELQHTVVPWTWEVGPDDVRGLLATHSSVAVLPEREREELLDAAEAVVAGEVHRRGTPTVPWHRETLCVRWRPGGW